MHHNIRLLKIFNFLIGFSLFAPLAIIYFSKVSGSYALGASIFGITMLSSAIFEVPTGIWSDMVGRRGTIILGSWARVAAFVLYAIGLSYWWLVVGAIFEGLSRSFYSGNNDAFLHDTLADDGMEGEFDEHLGKASSPEHLALALSGLIGGFVATYSFSYAMWISVVSQVFLLIVSYLFIEPKTRRQVNPNIYSHLKSALRLFMTNHKLRLLSLASVMRFSFGELKFLFRGAFVNLFWPLWAIGVLNVISNFGASASYHFSGKIIKKFDALKVLIFQTIEGKVIGLIAYGLPNIFSPALMVIPSLMHGVGSVAERKLLQAEFSESSRATMSSLNSLLGSGAFFLMSLFLGRMADTIGPSKALFIVTVMELPVIYIYWLVFKKDREKKT